MQEWANVWSLGGIFAFSGVDGETNSDEPFVASGLHDGIGWRFNLDPQVKLQATLGQEVLAPRNRTDDMCFPDCWRCAVAGGGVDGHVYGAYLNRSAMAVVFEFDDLPEEIYPVLASSPAGCVRNGLLVIEGKGWWLAVCPESPDRVMQVGVAISYGSEAEAVERARAARVVDVPAAIRRRMQYYEQIEPPESVMSDRRRAFFKAAGVQKANVESGQLNIACRWTTSSRMPHGKMWVWNSAFHALGLMHVHPDIAMEAIQALFASQREDGELPSSMRPGPLQEGTVQSQPPILSWAVWHLYDHIRDEGLLAELYYPLVRYVQWFEANRANANGLYGWDIRSQDHPVAGARGAESGMDNSPRFDRVERMTAADLSAYMAAEYGALERIAGALGKMGDRERWCAMRSRIGERINELLWDDEDRFYYDLNERDEFIPVMTPAGLIPMLAKVPNRDQAESLRLHIVDEHKLWSPFPIASVAQDEESYSDDMYRGPAWPNLNLLVYHGLVAYGFYEEAARLAHRTLDEIAVWYRRTGCLYECYDARANVVPTDLPRKGGVGEAGATGFGVIADLHWTAAVYIHFANLVG